MSDPIYMDYNATTPLDPAVFEVMEPYLPGYVGNPSSDHFYGFRARAAMGVAREQVAALFGAAPQEVIFTGGGSEANNLAMKGIASMFGARGDQLICSAVEHPSVAESLRFLVRQGYHLTIVPVDRDGRVNPAHVAAALTDRTILVSIMHANNEVGTLQPIRAIAELVHARGVLLHTDAAQTVGKVPVRRDLLECGSDQHRGPQVLRADGGGGAHRPTRSTAGAAHPRSRT